MKTRSKLFIIFILITLLSFSGCRLPGRLPPEPEISETEITEKTNPTQYCDPGTEFTWNDLIIKTGEKDSFYKASAEEADAIIVPITITNPTEETVKIDFLNIKYYDAENNEVDSFAGLFVGSISRYPEIKPGETIDAILNFEYTGEGIYHIVMTGEEEDVNISISTYGMN